MGVKQYKPTSAGRRFTSVSDFAEITTNKPYKPLLEPIKKHGGRNNSGHLSMRHQGGGAKRMYRVIDFKRNHDGVPANVATIEYDPNRSARIALINYADGNCLQLADIPVGTVIHAVEFQPGKGAAIARSAGTSIQLMGKEGKYAILRMPSSEMRRVLLTCRATIGEVGNAEHANIRIGKAGRNRLRGIRPTVRGTVMNPVDHPHGGGEGKNHTSGRASVSPWGTPSKGYKTRARKKRSNHMIIRRRKK